MPRARAVVRRRRAPGMGPAGTLRLRLLAFNHERPALRHAPRRHRRRPLQAEKRLSGSWDPRTSPRIGLPRLPVLHASPPATHIHQCCDDGRYHVLRGLQASVDSSPCRCRRRWRLRLRHLGKTIGGAMSIDSLCCRSCVAIDSRRVNYPRGLRQGQPSHSARYEQLH